MAGPKITLFQLFAIDLDLGRRDPFFNFLTFSLELYADANILCLLKIWLKDHVGPSLRYEVFEQNPQSTRVARSREHAFRDVLTRI